MKIVGSKRVKGVRAEIFSIASKFGGLYFHTKEQSIFFSGEDLVIKILFEDLSYCVRFVNEVDSRFRYYFLLTTILINRSIETVIGNFPITGVMQRDYVSTEDDLETFTLCSHVTYKMNIDSQTEVMMIENPLHDDFFGLNCYKCYLMNKSDFPEEKDNPNNVLWTSWPTHQRFDGLRTTDDYRVPLFAISFVGRTMEIKVIDCVERERVEIAVECVDDVFLEIQRNRMKSGSVVDEIEKKIVTSVYVEDAEDFQRCLTYKYNETKFLWTQRDRGAELTEEEAHYLRKSARVQAQKEVLPKKIGV